MAKTSARSMESLAMVDQASSYPADHRRGSGNEGFALTDRRRASLYRHRLQSRQTPFRLNNYLEGGPAPIRVDRQPNS